MSSDAMPTPVAVAANPLLGDALALAALAAVPVVLAGCGGGSAAGAPAAASVPAANVFTAVTVRVTADQAATVRVNATADQDGVTADNAGSVRFAISDPGVAGPTRELPYVAVVTATASASTAQRDFHVSINPDPAAALAANPAAFLRVRHFLTRAGFGASLGDTVRWMKVPYATMVDRIVDGTRATGQLPEPDWRDEPNPTWQEVAAMTLAQREALNQQTSTRLSAVQGDWLREMVAGDSPLTERMTLFWHNHFVTTSSDIFIAQTTWQYLALLRTHATGSFRALTHAMAKNPAMIMFLNSDSNVKGKPNENFARELLELFTLGEGQVYTEADVVAVAKCFTGYGLTNRQLWQFTQAKHEPGSKTVLGTAIDNGSNGEQDGDDAIDVILAQDRCARFIVEKLWADFIGGTPDSGTVATWAAAFKSGNYQIKPLLKTLFKSTWFTDPAQRGRMLRSPIELHAGLYRSLGVEPTNYPGEVWQASQEDQHLLNPPNVRGWVGGMAWINAKSLLERRIHLEWMGYGVYNRVNPLLDGVLDQLALAAPPYDTAALAATPPSWDPRRRIRTLLVDPAIHLR